MNLKPKIYFIVATDLKGGIGIKGKLPWSLPKDMAYFQKVTIQTDNIQFRNMVIMGRITWDSIPEKHRPLEGRKNVVVTRNKDYKVPKGVRLAHSIEEALKMADERVADIYIIGGAKIYEQYMKQSKLDGIYLTRIQKEFKCDSFFPRIPNNYKAEKLGSGEEKGIKYDFLFYKKGKPLPKAKPNRLKGNRRKRHGR